MKPRLRCKKNEDARLEKKGGGGEEEEKGVRTAFVYSDSYKSD